MNEDIRNKYFKTTDIVNLGSQKERNKEKNFGNLIMKTCQRKVKSGFKKGNQGFPGGAVVKNPPANAGDTGSSPGPGRSHIKKIFLKKGNQRHLF